MRSMRALGCKINFDGRRRKGEPLRSSLSISPSVFQPLHLSGFEGRSSPPPSALPPFFDSFCSLKRTETGKAGKVLSEAARVARVLLSVGALGSFTQVLPLFFYCIRTLSAPNPPNRSVYSIKGFLASAASHLPAATAAAVFLHQRCSRG